MTDKRLDPEAIKAALKAGRENGEGWGMSTSPTSKHVTAMRIVQAIAEAPVPAFLHHDCTGFIDDCAGCWWEKAWLAARALVGGDDA